MSNMKIVGLTLAATAAVAFTVIPAASFAASNAKKVPCYGVNSCKGKSTCKTAMNTCKGKNSCKGKGAMLKTEKQCAKLKGSTTAPAENAAAPAAAPAAPAPAEAPAQ